MNQMNLSTSSCRYCRFYDPEGRRGGTCQRLGVPVQGSWKACSFALHPFETTLKKLENIFHLPSSIDLPNTIEMGSDSQLASKLKKIKVEDVCQLKASGKQELI